MHNTHIYLIPGLAFDARIFKYLNLDGFEVHHLEWIEPKSNEKMASYATRFFTMPHTSHDTKIILIGHSFGGIMAQEIAHHYPIDAVILLASIKEPSEIPLHFRLLKATGLGRFFSKKISISTLPLWGGLHDFNNADKRSFLISMIKKYSDSYLKWALHNLLYWKKKEISGKTKIIQIHGTKDRTFPISKIKRVDYTIPNGSHIMLYTKASETNQVLKEVLSEYL